MKEIVSGCFFSEHSVVHVFLIAISHNWPSFDAGVCRKYLMMQSRQSLEQKGQHLMQTELNCDNDIITYRLCSQCAYSFIQGVQTYRGLTCWCLC